MKKELLLSFFLFLICLIIYLSETFGLFEVNRTIPIESDLAKWQILVNAKEIVGKDKEFVVDEINWTSNENIKEGKAAPGLKAYFDIIIDPSGTETAIEIELISLFKENLLPNIYIEKVLLNNEELIPENEIYKTIVSLDDVLDGKKTTFRVFIYWENNDDIQENDYVGIDKTLDLPMKLKILQYVG